MINIILLAMVAMCTFACSKNEPTITKKYTLLDTKFEPMAMYLEMELVEFPIWDATMREVGIDGSVVTWDVTVRYWFGDKYIKVKDFPTSGLFTSFRVMSDNEIKYDRSINEQQYYSIN